MRGGTLEIGFALVCLALVGAAGAALLVWMGFVRPRLGLYTVLALSPTQFVFIPVANFFVSPADVVVLACTAGMVARVLIGNPQTRRAVRLHVMLGVMIAGYLVGFVVLDHVSRTLVRVPLAIVPSILACELLHERKHFRWAIASLLGAAILDAGYGIYFLGIGERLHPTRFSGMMGVNFSAIVILTGAAMAFARFSRTREPLALALPVVLTLFGFATLSKMGILALVMAWAMIVWWVATPRSRRLVVVAATVLFLVGVSQDPVRDSLLARSRPELQRDGVARTSTDVRVLVLRSVWRALAEQPFVGIGYFNFERYSRQDPIINASTAGAGYATHNTYLEVLVEGGLLAFVPFLLHFLGYGRGLRHAWVAVVRRQDAIVGAALAGLLVVMASAAAANLLLLYLFWSVCGMALACLERLRAEETTPRPAYEDGASGSVRWRDTTRL